MKLVVTQPDKPQGRGLSLSPPPVKSYALARGVPVLQPEKARDGALRDALAALDLASAGGLYGKILRRRARLRPLAASRAPRSFHLAGRGAHSWAPSAAQAPASASSDGLGEDTGPVSASRRRHRPTRPRERSSDCLASRASSCATPLRASVRRAHARPQPAWRDACRMTRSATARLDFSALSSRARPRARLLSWPGASPARRLRIRCIARAWSPRPVSSRCLARCCHRGRRSWSLVGRERFFSELQLPEISAERGAFLPSIRSRGASTFGET